MTRDEVLPLPENRVRSLERLRELVGRNVYFVAVSCLAQTPNDLMPLHLTRIRPWTVGPVVMSGYWTSDPSRSQRAVLADFHDAIDGSTNVRLQPLEHFNCLFRSSAENCLNAIFETEDDAVRWVAKIRLAYYDEIAESEPMQKMARQDFDRLLPSMTIEYHRIGPRVVKWKNFDLMGSSQA